DAPPATSIAARTEAAVSNPLWNVMRRLPWRGFAGSGLAGATKHGREADWARAGRASQAKLPSGRRRARRRTRRAQLGPKGRGRVTAHELGPRVRLGEAPPGPRAKGAWA